MPEGERPSELDRLRRPPFAPTITGLVQALERLCDVRALGVGGLDLSALPPRRVAALARYVEDAGPPSSPTWRRADLAAGAYLRRLIRLRNATIRSRAENR